MKIICKEDYIYHGFLIFIKNKWYNIESPKLKQYKNEKSVVLNESNAVMWYLVDEHEEEELLEYFKDLTMY